MYISNLIVKLLYGRFQQTPLNECFLEKILKFEILKFNQMKIKVANPVNLKIS